MDHPGNVSIHSTDITLYLPKASVFFLGFKPEMNERHSNKDAVSIKTLLLQMYTGSSILPIKCPRVSEIDTNSCTYKVDSLWGQNR